MTELQPVGRAFRLHLRHGVVLDGWVTADGQAVAVEDEVFGLATSAPTIADLVRGYGGGRIEWLPPAGPPAPPAQQGDPR